MEDKIREHISEFLGKPVSTIEDITPLSELAQESFRLVELVIDLQEEFGIQIVQNDLKSVKTAGDLVNLVALKKTEKDTQENK